MTNEASGLLIGTGFILFCGSVLLVGLATGKMIAPSGIAYRSKRPMRFWRLTAIYLLGTLVGLFIAASALGV